MIRLRQIKIRVEEDSISKLISECIKKLNIKKEDIINYEIKKKSLDARKKPNLYYSYIIDLNIKNEKQILSKNKSTDIFLAPDETYYLPKMGTIPLNHRPIIVGAGPCGLICGYILAEAGYNPIIIERGEEVDKRITSVENFWETGNLNINSNVQFGEGGAGTFSDGKLNTLVKDQLNRQKKVFEIFVEANAPKEILYVNKPHIGTNLLRVMVKNIRNKIISMGGEFLFESCMTDIKIENNMVKGIEINHSKLLETDILIIALGHSARDTFEMLLNKKLEMKAKPFAVGIRIQHPQTMIDKNQYGKIKNNLPKSSYKLTYNSSDNRGVYTFCMCPGGYVVNASSENNMLAINGMSNYERESKNANSAVIVTVSPKDFGNNPLDGMNFQRNLEKKAFQVGKGKIPIQLYKDFKNNEKSTKLGKIDPIFQGNYYLSNLNDILPKYISNSLIEGIDYFDRKLPGFAREDVILAAVESRTSSPVRILRDENYESNIKGIYPGGEGAGYAGGITSAAIDGMKIAEQIISIYTKI